MPSTMYDRVGGVPFFETLTTHFYRGVATDPVLRPLYPEDDAAFEASRRWLRDFLVQYWGGPTTYSDERGHPRHVGQPGVPLRSVRPGCRVSTRARC
jgi:hemoglobin